MLILQGSRKPLSLTKTTSIWMSKLLILSQMKDEAEKDLSEVITQRSWRSAAPWVLAQETNPNRLRAPMPMLLGVRPGTRVSSQITVSFLISIRRRLRSSRRGVLLTSLLNIQYSHQVQGIMAMCLSTCIINSTYLSRRILEQSQFSFQARYRGRSHS